MCDSSSPHQFSSCVLVVPVPVRLHRCDSAILSVQVRKKFGITVATFTQPGPLGLRFVASTTTDEEAVEVLGIQPDSQAASHPRLRIGMTLTAIGEVPIRGKGYQEVIRMIKHAGRPLELHFKPGVAVGSRPLGERSAIVATFTEPGTLGLKFTPNKQTGNVELLQVNAGTQAERHPQLQAGLILRSVDGTSVSGKAYNEVIGMIKAGGRPLPLSFSPGGTVVASPRKPRPSRQQADPTGALTGKAAQQALQEHIRTKGTGDVKKIDRLRRASLQADVSPAGQTAQAANAAAMAAAMAEIDEDEDEMESSPARLEIEALYRQHNPEKLADVDTLVQKYGERKLLAMVRKKYRVPAQKQAQEPSATTTTVHSMPPRLAADSDHSVVRARVVTWNCGNHPPLSSLMDLVHAGPEGSAQDQDDIFVLGLQESVVDQTGASVGNASKAKQIAKGSIGITSSLDQFWIDCVSGALGDGWHLVSLQTLGEMRLLVWARDQIKDDITELETADEACGIGGVVGNKGGLVCKFKVKDTSLCFISVHLAAHEGEKKATKRNADIREILSGARLGSMKWMDAASQFDHTWFIGDMNYRIDLQQLDGVEREQKQHVYQVLDKIESKDWVTLQRADQFSRELTTHRVLVGFQEGQLDYAPTFKLERQPGLHYGHKRVPSYCDRILFKSLPGLSGNHRQQWVRPVSSVATSDHKPVVSLHDVRVRTAQAHPAPETSAYIEITGLHATRLTAMDANGKSDAYVKFHSAALDVGKRTPQTKVIKATVDPRWDNAHVPTLNCGFKTLADVQRQQLYCAVWDKDFGSADDLIGTAVVSLGACDGCSAPVHFEADVVRDGQVHGKLYGRMQIRAGAAGAEQPSSKVVEISDADWKSSWYQKPQAPLEAGAESSLLSVRVATFNAGNTKPGDLHALVRGNPSEVVSRRLVDETSDIFVLGLQESVVDQTGASVGNASKAKQIAKGSIGITSSLDQFWIDCVSGALGDGWHLVSLQTLGEMRLLVWARDQIKDDITELETADEACGIGGVVGNKGGLVCKFKVKDTSLCFISVHLAAHEGEKKATKRNADIREILSGARLGSMKWMDAASQFDHTWFIGDMNYRIDLQQLDGVEREKERHIDDVLGMIESKDWVTLQRADQLHREVSSKRVLVGFQEGQCNYPPTFKCQPGEELQFGRKRVPSYCDRILFRSQPGFAADLVQEWVHPVKSITSSDHKPVVAVHTLRLQEPSRSVGGGVRVGVTVSNLHGSKLTAMDTNGKSDPYVRFDATVWGNPKTVCKTKVAKSTLDPRWSVKDVPKIEGSCNTAESLDRSHLILSVFDKDVGSVDDLIGTCVVALKGSSWNTGEPIEFNEDVCKDGTVHGKLAGRLQLHHSIDTSALTMGFVEEDDY